MTEDRQISGLLPDGHSHGVTGKQVGLSAAFDSFQIAGSLQRTLKLNEIHAQL